MLKKRKHTVFCDGCANLLYIGDIMLPKCVASARFVKGPLRRRIDIVGVVDAENRNIHNDCELREAVSQRAWHLKKWLLWRLNDGNNGQIKRKDIKHYSVSEETHRKKDILCKEVSSTKDYRDEKVSSEIQRESIHLIGGFDGDYGGGSSDEDRGKDFQDSGDSSGHGGEHVCESEFGADD